MKFKKYYFENYPLNTPFDIRNPRYVLSLDGTDEILEQIVNKPYTLEGDDFENVQLINHLLYIGVLQSRDEKLGLAMPFFTKNDVEVLKNLSKHVAKDISEEIVAHEKYILKIIEQVQNGYSCERNLYHLLCGHIFDGRLFDYLEEKNLVTTHRVHKNGLDYLIVLYEDIKELSAYSEKLLCSYNRYTKNGKGFVSFGDSDGIRKDFYRYSRLKELNVLPAEQRMYFEFSIEDLVENFEMILAGKTVPKEYLEIYNFFGYCDGEKISVPVYDARAFKIAEELYNFVLQIIEKKLTESLTVLSSETRLCAIRHGVQTKDVANEIYHLIFGEVNELLVQNGVVAKPEYLHGEGRFFKAFEI